MSKNWHQKHQENQSFGKRFALGFVATMGTIQFVVAFNIIVIVWVTFNVWALFVAHWDPYPFILLNLFFSWQASNAASFILIASNDQAARDKVQAEHQYEHQEQQLKFNTDVTQAMHKLTKEIHAKIVGEKSGPSN